MRYFAVEQFLLLVGANTRHSRLKAVSDAA